MWAARKSRKCCDWVLVVLVMTTHILLKRETGGTGDSIRHCYKIITLVVTVVDLTRKSIVDEGIRRRHAWSFTMIAS